MSKNAGLLLSVVVAIGVAGVNLGMKASHSSPPKAVKAVVTNVPIPINILGGAVINIPNKGALLIDGARYQKASQEIGKEKLQSLTRAFLSKVPSATLIKEYVTQNTTATNAIILSYKNLVE